MLNKIINWIRNRRNFVILDPNDSSVTLSRALFRHIKKESDAHDLQPKVFVFYIPETKCYGFTINPNLDQTTQLADIQYNTKHRCIGFETLNPTVARILFDYNVVQFMKPCKLTVTSRLTEYPKTVYYQIERPHEKFTRKTSTL